LVCQDILGGSVVVYVSAIILLNKSTNNCVNIIFRISKHGNPSNVMHARCLIDRELLEYLSDEMCCGVRCQQGN
jgi:hypothetical protein